MTASVQDFIAHVAKVSHAIGFQAGVGGRETAGAIISYLAQHPDKLDAFMQGGVFAWGTDEWITGGCLTWQANDGKVWHPADARAARAAEAALKAGEVAAVPITHDADCISFFQACPGPCDCSAAVHP